MLFPELKRKRSVDESESDGGDTQAVADALTEDPFARDSWTSSEFIDQALNVGAVRSTRDKLAQKELRRKVLPLLLELEPKLAITALYKGIARALVAIENNRALK